MKPVSLTRVPPTSVAVTRAEITKPQMAAGANLCVGDIVEHERFGLGKVLSLDGGGNGAKAVVDFQGVGQKTLLLSFAKLKKVNS